MTDPKLVGDYHYELPTASHTDAYLLPSVRNALVRVAWQAGGPRRLFELGCGNGATAAALVTEGYTVTGVDPSPEGVAVANRHFPQLAVAVGSCYDDLAAKYGTFPAVLSLEVVEHVFLPRVFAKCVADLLTPGGLAVISTPYHGYWKNLALALTGSMDHHYSALWDYGHIKFWSVPTLTTLLAEAGLTVERVYRVGRIPPLAKGMVVAARKKGG